MKPRASFLRRVLTSRQEHPTDLSSSQLHVISIVILSCSALSLVGCLYILRHHYVSATRHRGASMVQKMVVVLSLLDAGLSCLKLVGHPLPSSLGCTLQAATLQCFGLLSVFWYAAIAHCFYRKIVHRDSDARLKSRFKLYLLLALVPAVGSSVALYAARLYGDAIFYCWITARAHQFWAFYLFVLLASLYMSFILWVTHHNMVRDVRHANLEAQESWSRITLKFRIYIAAFLVLWTPSTIFRLFRAQLGTATFGIALAMQLTMCTQGLTTAIIYGGLLTKVYQTLACTDSIVPAQKCIASPTYPTMDLRLVQQYRRPANLFVSTFNMGEAKLPPAQLDKWIPRGHDIYVIGLQECLHLTDTRRLIKEYLERGRPRPPGSTTVRHATTFHQFHREIGRNNTSLGYHGHIAITVYIKASDIESGAFYMPPVVQQEVNVGKSLVLGRASNKGAVGFAFRYYDTSFAFVACHFASDPKGKSNVQRRNRDARQILQKLHLNLEDVGLEFPHVHHHSFVLGDLNYRLTQRDATAETILELVSKVRQCEVTKPLPSKRTRPLRRGLLGIRWSPMGTRSFSSSFGLASSKGTSSDGSDWNELDVSMLGKSAASVNGSVQSGRDSIECDFVDENHFVWDDVLAHDELRTGMRNGTLFFGFREAKIAFPPTFRRVRGQTLDLDAETWSMEDLRACYTTTVVGHGRRVPSYTDRILYFSQQDMRHRLRCAAYASCENVTCSDHKPVLAVFQALVNRKVLPIETELSTKKLQRMQEVEGVVECQLRLTLSAMSWHPVALALASFPRSFPLDSRFATLDRHGYQILVTIVFPLPSEDIFSAQRKLLELAESMRGGVYLENTDRRFCKTNVAQVKWVDFVRDGITHVTYARPTGNMHVGIKVHAGTQGPCFGQGVICIPPSPPHEKDEAPEHSLTAFRVDLAQGGKHQGTMAGSVGLKLLQTLREAN
ncbi:hypothetical protein PsorP6_008298 [Peronosclerospora sorghi]|uniref:Uncharacterized protein n=1 Tax=Peronosclerospora sorghi TaxID=230839 RepID=A0ACC0W9D6_9STRA|nr:hypothetical protein PsorP6_008298 [Peronosclerospora sorghi]